MLFNSYIFVLLFLPLTLCGYFLLNRIGHAIKQKNAHFPGDGYDLGRLYLLGMSLWFYAYFNIKYLPIIVGSILVNYVTNLALRRCGGRAQKVILIAALLLNLGVLVYFKYYNFFIENINVLFGSTFTLHRLVLPLGISFFTFQQLSYVIDTYKGTVPDYNILDYALFVTFFPQLIAGPIVTHDEIVPQFADVTKKHLHADNFARGLMAFAFGLAKKVLVADTFGNAVNFGYANVDALDTTNALLLTLFYTIQIYFDFSGYCDMATGFGLMFNISITQNFNSPYRALTITDFWKRWHITLTRFFTRYVYIPLGGSRKGSLRTWRNMFLVFVVSGLWHGAGWAFVLWGTVHGVFSIITRRFQPWFDKLHPAFNWILTFSFVNAAWVLFRAEDITLAGSVFSKIGQLSFGPILPGMASPFLLPEFEWLFGRWAPTGLNPSVFAMAFLLFALFAVLFMKNTNERVLAFRPTVGTSLVTAGLLFWCVLSFSGVSTFLYFNF